MTTRETATPYLLTSRQEAADRANARAQAICQKALAASGGRTTYSHETDNFRYVYEGDVVTERGTKYGRTTRAFLKEEGTWTPEAHDTTGVIPSDSGTGFINLSLEYLQGSTDPVVAAKRELVWLLLDPALDVVGNALALQKRWDLSTTSGHVRAHMTERLAEVLEQVVLANPSAGLDIEKVANGTPVVGWAVKAVAGSVFNTGRRVKHNEKPTTSWRVGDEGGASDLYMSADDLGSSAEVESSETESRRSADVLLDEYVSGSRVQRKSEAFQSALLRRQFDIPDIHVPDLPARKAVLAALESDGGDDLAIRSLEVYWALIEGHPSPSHTDVSNDMLEVWREFSSHDCEMLLGLVPRVRALPAVFVRGALGFMPAIRPSEVTKLRRALQEAGVKGALGPLIDAYSRARSTGVDADFVKLATRLVKNNTLFVDVADVERTLTMGLSVL